MDLLPLQSVPVPILAVVVGLAGLALLGLAAREVWLGLRYRSRRPLPIGELAEASGRVLVSGVAHRAERTVEAPITGTDCFAYRWRVTDVVTDRDLGGDIDVRRHNVGMGSDAVPFLLEDYSGTVLVDPAGAELRLLEEWVPDPVGDPVERADVLTGGESFGGEARARQYYESRVDEGETVTVRGRVRPETDKLLSIEQVGVRISGGDTLVDDATPTGAARRAFRQAAVTGLTGLFMLGILGVLLLVGAV